jgi:hypothetical protein
MATDDQTIWDDSVEMSGGTNVRSVNSVRIGMEASTIAIVVSLLVIIFACGAVMGVNLSEQQALRREFATRQQTISQDLKDQKTQIWLLERRLMDREALDIVNGTKLPSDDEHGATGNLQRMKPKR